MIVVLNSVTMADPSESGSIPTIPLNHQASQGISSVQVYSITQEYSQTY